jgi:hypothetical protein
VRARCRGSSRSSPLLQVNRQRRQRGQAPRWLLAFLTLLAVLYSVNPISSPRYYFGTVILTVIAALGAYATPARVRTSSLGFLLALFLLFPVADIFRSTTGTVSFDPLRALTTGDFDGLIQLINTLRYIDLEGITWGMQFLGVLLFWVLAAFGSTSRSTPAGSSRRGLATSLRTCRRRCGPSF